VKEIAVKGFGKSNGINQSLKTLYDATPNPVRGEESQPSRIIIWMRIASNISQISD
jgi:hypothetical protein